MPRTFVFKNSYNRFFFLHALHHKLIKLLGTQPRLGPDGLEILLLTVVTTASTLTCSFLSSNDHYSNSAALKKIVLAWRSVVPT